jgi:uncharacterized protein with PQ loop repeat
MSTMRTNHPLHHLHIRKRMTTRREAYQNPALLVHALDKVIYLVGFLGPISTLPQIYEIYASHNAAGISVFTWSTYTVFSVVWILYGLVHRERVITFTYCLWLIMNGLVALGAILYR